MAKQERAKGRRAIVRMDKIEIEGQRFRWNTDTKELEIERHMVPKNGGVGRR